ncbi:hypothetical protein Sste5346_002247 [Sporothrix stenoceras]|uniref:Uncharacterized protein n=1 Tax=Sporothrix stenoceras TaxID=5173 RepID=A0ABR3ZK50_9PEZI
MAQSEEIEETVRRYKEAHNYDPSADPETQPDIWDKYRIDSQPIKDEVDRLEALRTKAQIIRGKHHRRFRFLDKLRDQERARENRKQLYIEQRERSFKSFKSFRSARPVRFTRRHPPRFLAMPGEDVQPMPRPPAMARSHNPGWVLRGQGSPSIRHARKANAAKFIQANRRLHNRVVLARNLRKHGDDAFYQHLQE